MEFTNEQEQALGAVALENIGILNNTDLADLIAGTKHSAGHIKLIKALHKGYPACVFRLVKVRESINSEGGIFSDCFWFRIAESHQDWMLAAYDAAGGCAHKVWKKFKDLEYYTTEFQVEHLYIAMPYGSAPAAFVQIEVKAYHEVAGRPLFDTSWGAEPKGLQDLLHPLLWPSLNRNVEVAPWFYKLLKVTDFREFYGEMIEINPTNQQVSTHEMDPDDGPLDTWQPNWLSEPNGDTRLLVDWASSSAGRSGHLFCDHWPLTFLDHDSNGARKMRYLALNSDRDSGIKLSKIESSKYATDSLLMAKLEKFDLKAGFPMAWYFNMLQDKWIRFVVGKRVARGIQDGRINLPPHDVEVIARWYGNPYGI